MCHFLTDIKRVLSKNWPNFNPSPFTSMTTVREKRGYGLLVWQMTSIITIIRSYRSINDDGSCENYISSTLDKWSLVQKKLGRVDSRGKIYFFFGCCSSSSRQDVSSNFCIRLKFCSYGRSRLNSQCGNVNFLDIIRKYP